MNVGFQQVGVSDELRGVGSGGATVDLARAGDLFQFAGTQQGDAVGHDHRFVLIVRDKDEGDADLALQSFEFDLHLAAQVGVEGGERLIEQ